MSSGLYYFGKKPPQAFCGTQAAEDGRKAACCDRACLPRAAFPWGRKGTSHEPFRQLCSGLKIPEVFTGMVSSQFKEGEHKRDWALWVLVGPDNNSVGRGWGCRQQLYHVSLEVDKGSRSAWLSWGNLSISTLSFCT